MSRLVSNVAGLAAGGLLAVSALVGSAASTTEPIPRSEPLDLERYCRAEHGDEATVYRQPEDLDRWGCSAETNGIWGLEPVDLHEVCRWQRGEDAVLERRKGSSERALACTL